MRACNNLPQPCPYISVFGGCRRLLHALTPPRSAFLYLQFLARCHPYFIFNLVILWLQNGESPLLAAIGYNNCEMVEDLLGAGADPNMATVCVSQIQLVQHWGELLCGIHSSILYY